VQYFRPLGRKQIVEPDKAPVMRDQIHRAIIELILLSHTVNRSERTRVLETVDRFRDIVEEDDHSISLYGKLLLESDEPPMKS
jgi:hypothetical protein